ncbi:tetratricopeptide repeat protein, partial [Dehalococcoidia bacterium]|nr:tetratricopeptide repeat protein [Dehalococcoidia bacterium]
MGDAEEAYKKAANANKDPHQDLYWRNLGNCLLHQEKFDESEDAYRSALTINETNAITLYDLAYVLRILNKPEEAEEFALRIHQISPDKLTVRKSWRFVASLREQLGRSADQILFAYASMARAVEAERSALLYWEDRLEAFTIPALSLQRASTFAIEPYPLLSLDFANQSKGRTLQEFLEYDSDDLRKFIDLEEQQQYDKLTAAYEKLNILQGNPNLPAEKRYTTKDLTDERVDPILSEQRLTEEKQKLDNDYDAFFQKVVSNHPELEAFISGPTPRRFKFSLSKLQKRLQHGEAVLELLDNLDRGLLIFLAAKEGLANHSLWPNEENSNAGPTLEEWRSEVISTLHIGQGQRADSIRAEGIKRDLTPEVLTRWGQL